MIKKLISLTIALICLLAILASLLLTPAGLKISLFIFNKTSASSINYQKVEGLLSGPIHFTNFTYTNKNSTIHIKDLNFDWKLTDFFRRTLTINNLKVNHMVVNIQSKTTDQPVNYGKLLTNITLPSIKLNILQANINNLKIINNKKTIAHIRDIHVQASIIQKKFNLLLKESWKKPFKINNVISIKGIPNDYVIIINNQLGTQQMTIQGHGNNKGLQLKITRSFSKIPISAKLVVTWLPQLSWNLSLSGKNIDLSNIIDDAPLINKLTIDSKGHLIKQQPIFHLNMTIQSNDNHVNLNVSHNTNWHAKWDININNQFYTLPIQLASIQSKGTLQGNQKHLISKGQAQLTSLVFNTLKFNQLNATWNISPKFNKLSNILITAKDITATQVEIPKLSLRIRGTTINHLIEANAIFNQTPIHLDLVGHYLENNWSARITKFTVDAKDKFTLKKPLNFYFKNNQLNIPNLCLSSGSLQKLCANISSHKDTWHSSITGAHLNLNNVLTHYIPNYTLTSKADFTATLSGNNKSLQQANVQLNISAGRLSSKTKNITVSHKILKSSAQLTLKNNRLSTKVNIKLANNDHIQGQFTATNLDMIKHDITGNANVKLTNFSPRSPALPYIISQGSTLHGNLKITGTSMQPKITGKFILKSPSLFIENFNISLKNIQATISANKQQINTKVTAESNNNPVTLTTKTLLKNNQFISSAHLEGTNILIINTPEYQIYANPNLTATINNHHIKITGNILIPKAHIKPDIHSNVAYLPEDDITIIGENKQNLEKKWTLESAIDAKIGKEVFIDIVSVKAQLTGQLSIFKKTYQTFLANGHISVVKGKFISYGHTLTVQPNSAIIFTNSPLVNPTINVKASNIIQVKTAGSSVTTLQNNIIVGVQLTGLIRKPDWSFYSIPATLSQSDIISYLILGKAASSDNPQFGQSSSSSQISSLLNAINALKISETALSKYGGFTQQISNSLGLSELGVEQSQSIDAIGNYLDSQTTSLVVGKYLSPSIYVRYSYEYLNEAGTTGNNTNAYNEFQLNWILNNSWTLQLMAATEGGSTANIYFIDPNQDRSTYGFDLIYTIKRK